jgi:hypothetical protein
MMGGLMKSSNEIFLFTVLFILLLFSSGSNYAMPAGDKNAKIVFDKTIHDFGKVQQGTVLEYSFKFTNEGSGKLIIIGVNASCGCTGAIIDGKKVFEEDESGNIKVSFNTQGREGVQSKSVIVQSNDPANPQIILTFSCEIYA